MNSNQIPKPDESLDELDMDEISSVEDFIKELEAKEKDLHITSDMTIEIEDNDFDTVPEFVLDDLSQTKIAAPKSVAVAAPAAKVRNHELEGEVANLKVRVYELRNERNEIQEKSDRRLKDFENYKYRMDRERRGSFIDQISNLAAQMLPVLDNLDRALDAAENSKTKRSDEFEQFYHGIVLVNQQVNEILSEMGVQPIAPVGEEFDPNFHEAVAVEERDDMQPNMITEEMLRGFRIGNRVIRHSMVKVTSGPPKPPASEGDEVTISDEDMELLNTSDAPTRASDTEIEAE